MNDYLDTIIEKLTFQHIWGVEIMITKWGILSIALALLYYWTYIDYKKIREEYGEAAEKWLSPVLYALILFAINYILEVIDNIADGLFLYAIFFAGLSIYSIISLAALLSIPIVSTLIYKRQYKRFVEGKVDEAAIKKVLSPRIFGVLALVIEAAVYYGYLFIQAMGSV